MEHLSLEDAIMASKGGINCLSYLVQLVEQPLLIYRNIILPVKYLKISVSCFFFIENEQAVMSERTLPNDMNNESNLIHPIHFQTSIFVFILVQNETNQPLSNADIPFTTPLTNAALTTTADINNLPIEEPIDIVGNYEPPTLIKALESTFHPRTLKEFAQTRSSPIKCIDSKQREPIGIRVRNCLKN